MANICTNQLILTNKAFKKIAHLFTQSEFDYEKPYLDFQRIVPVPKGASADEYRYYWGVRCRPYDTEVRQDEREDGFTTVVFNTHWIAPHAAIEAMVRKYKIEAELYSFEPGNQYTCIAKYNFEDGFNPEIDNVDDFLMIEMDQDDIDDTCLQIFGMTYAEYIGEDEDEGYENNDDLITVP